MCCCVRVDTYCIVTNKPNEAGCIGQHKYCISLYYLAFVTIIKINYYITTTTTTTTIKTITLDINPYISQETSRHTDCVLCSIMLHIWYNK